jgi:hypothetical protein
VRERGPLPRSTRAAAESCSLSTYGNSLRQISWDDVLLAIFSLQAHLRGRKPLLRCIHVRPEIWSEIVVKGYQVQVYPPAYQGIPVHVNPAIHVPYLFEYEAG